MTKQITQVHGKAEIPGILIEKESISFSTHNLVSGDHFFIADDFRLVRKGDQIVILFGTISQFSTEKSFNLAIELSLPAKLAIDFLYRVIWERHALNSDKALVHVVEDMVAKDEAIFGAYDVRYKDYSIPREASNYRKFPSNFVTCAISHGQALLEFFEASPDIVVTLLHRRQVRPNSGVKNIVSVIMSQRLILEFFKELKVILEPFKEFATSKE
jgi:hypothetical protein